MPPDPATLATPPAPRARYFISAVSKELGTLRKKVDEVLRFLGYEVETMEIWGTESGDLRQVLRDKIDGCDGLIQLVGDAYGAEPPTPDPAFGRVSYTQFEFLYAQSRGKKTWLLIAGPDACRDTAVSELDQPGPGDRCDPAAYQAERRDLQAAYRTARRAQAHLSHKFGNATELENAVLRLRDDSEQTRREFRAWQQRLVEGQERNQRRLHWGLGGVAATVLLVGAGLLWFNYSNTKTIVAQTAAQQQITTERIRAHLLTAVEDTYRRDLQAAETLADWQAREQQRQAAATQRAAQLARIEDLAASFAAIEARGEASGVFTELTRILKEQGVDPALAYVAAKRVGILDQVRARQAAARQRNRDDLQPLLTSAGLYAAKGEAEPARALYQEVLELEPEWPAALDGNRRFLIAQGDLAVVRGRLPDAGRDFAQAKALAERLIGLEPDNRDWQRNIGLCLERIGGTKAAQGDLAGALADYGQSHAILEHLAAADPSNVGWQDDLSVSLIKLGDTKAAQGDLAGALADYGQCHAIRERLAAADPSNVGWQRDLSVSLANLGDTKAAQGDLAGALADYEQCHAILERLAAADPSNAGWQRDLSVSLERLGDTKAAQGDLAGALADYGQSLAIAERLAAADPSNAGWQRDLSVSLEKLGDTKAAQGDLAGARADYGQDRAICERLAASDPSNAGWQRDLSVSLNKLGDTKAAQGDLAGALADYVQSHAIRERLAAADPSNAGWQRDLYVSHWRLADLNERRGEPQAAQAHWRQAYAVLKGIQERGLHVSPADLAGLETIRARVQGTAR